MTIIDADIEPSVAGDVSSVSDLNEKLSKYSNMSDTDLLRLQVYILEKEAREREKYRKIVNRKLARIEKRLNEI